jgi:hypothetical protein
MRIIPLFLFLILTSTAYSQDFSQYEKEEEAVAKIARIQCDTVPALADSIYKAIKTRKFAEIEKYTPSLENLMATYDSLEIEGTIKMVRIKHNYLVVNLKKQHVVMLKKAKAYKVNLRTVVKIEQSISYSETDDGHRYAEVLYLVKKGKKKYIISFLAIELLDIWYIGDHLKIRRL